MWGSGRRGRALGIESPIVGICNIIQWHFLTLRWSEARTLGRVAGEGNWTQDCLRVSTRKLSRLHEMTSSWLWGQLIHLWTALATGKTVLHTWYLHLLYSSFPFLLHVYLKLLSSLFEKLWGHPGLQLLVGRTLKGDGKRRSCPRFDSLGKQKDYTFYKWS